MYLLLLKIVEKQLKINNKLEFIDNFIFKFLEYGFDSVFEKELNVVYSILERLTNKVGLIFGNFFVFTSGERSANLLLDGIKPVSSLKRLFRNDS